MYHYSMNRGCHLESTRIVHENLTNLLIEAMRDERYDRTKYKMMMDMTQNEKIRRQIEFAFNDEGKHYKMFQQILYKVAGRMEEVPEPQVKTYSNLIAAVEDSINGELEAVELYRRIYALLPTQQLRDIVYEIITDEQEHAARFIYVYSLLK